MARSIITFDTKTTVGRNKREDDSSIESLDSLESMDREQLIAMRKNLEKGARAKATKYVSGGIVEKEITGAIVAELGNNEAQASEKDDYLCAGAGATEEVAAFSFVAGPDSLQKEGTDKKQEQGLTEPPDMSRVVTKEETMLSLRDNDGIDFPSVSRELGWIIVEMGAKQKNAEDEQEVIELTSDELSNMREMIPLLEDNFEDDSMWIDGLRIMQETTEDNNFIDDMAFIAADHDYSELMNDPLLNFLQEKGGNNHKDIHEYLRYMYNNFRKQEELINLELMHQNTGKTQRNDRSTKGAPKDSANVSVHGDSARKESSAGRVDS